MISIFFALCLIPRPQLAEVTAYCACQKCCPGGVGITASGLPVSADGGKFVAADRRLPFGTPIYVPGYSTRFVRVLDRGGAIKGNRLDVYYDDHRRALRWGRRMLVVWIWR